MDTTAKEKALVIGPRITALFSMVGSGYIIWDVLKRRKSEVLKASGTHQRLLLGMSLYDFLVSFVGYFIGTWMAPIDSGLWGASGTTTTCETQGWFATWSIGVAFYNWSLSGYYLLKIRYNISQQQLSQKWEPFLHGIPQFVGIVLATTGLLLDQYNPLAFNCFIAGQPYGCQESWSSSNNGNGEEETTTCIRGDNSTYYVWILYYIPLWFTVLATGLNMFLVYLIVYQQEQKMTSYNFQYQQEKHNIQQELNKQQQQQQQQDDRGQEEKVEGAADGELTQQQQQAEEIMVGLDYSDNDEDENSSLGSSISGRMSLGSFRSTTSSVASAARRSRRSIYKQMASTSSNMTNSFRKSCHRRRKARQKQRKHFQRSRQAAKQGYLYCGAFFLTWIFPSILMFLGLIQNVEVPYWFLLFSMLFVPAQGLFNCLVYTYPKIHQKMILNKKRRKETTRNPLHNQQQNSNNTSRTSATQGATYNTATAATCMSNSNNNPISSSASSSLPLQKQQQQQEQEHQQEEEESPNIPED